MLDSKQEKCTGIKGDEVKTMKKMKSIGPRTHQSHECEERNIRER